MDADIRALERAAADGDREAHVQAVAEKTRRGEIKLPYWVTPAVYVDLEENLQAVWKAGGFFLSERKQRQYVAGLEEADRWTEPDLRAKRRATILRRIAACVAMLHEVLPEDGLGRESPHPTGDAAEARLSDAVEGRFQFPCPLCGARPGYDPDHDAWACLRCLVWLEGRCSQTVHDGRDWRERAQSAGCTLCSGRPVRPVVKASTLGGDR